MRRHSSRHGHPPRRRRAPHGLRKLNLGAAGPYSRRLRIEPLEDRSLLSAVSWDGGGDGLNWTDRFNWSGDVLPGLNDDVTIDAPIVTTVTLNAGSRTIQSLTVGADSVLHVLSPGSLTVSTTTAISGDLVVSGNVTLNGAASFAHLSLTTGNLGGAGDFQITGSMDWTGGKMIGTGKTVVAVGATMTLVNNQFGLTLQRTLINDGDVLWTSGSIMVSQGTFENNGTIVADSSHAHSLSVSSGAAFKNVGLFIDQGSGPVTISSGTFVNSGEVRILAGSFRLSTTGALSGLFNIADGAALLLQQSANLSIVENVAFDGDGAVHITGATLDVGFPTVFKHLVFSSGTLKGNADVTITGDLDWLGGTMSGAGETIVSEDATLTFQGTAVVLSRTLTNNGVATWISGSIQMKDGTFQNNGTFIAMGAYLDCIGTGGVNAFNNAGLFVHQSVSWVRFRKQSTSGVAFNNSGVADGGPIDPIFGDGGLEIASGGVQADGATFKGAVRITAPGFDFGATTNLIGSLRISAPWNVTENKTFNGPGVLTLAGVTTFAANRRLEGTVTVDIDSVISGVTDMNWTQSVQITDQGIINSAATFTSLNLLGDLSGSGNVTIVGEMKWVGGMSGTGKTIIAVGAVVNLQTGTGFSDINNRPAYLGRNLENNGVIEWTTGDLYINRATIQNNGLFTINGGRALWVANDGSVLNNAGELRKAGSAETTFANMGGPGIAVNNTGAIVIAGGVLAFDQVTGLSPLDSSGAIDIQEGVLRIDPALFTTGSGLLTGQASGRLEIEGNLSGDTVLPDQIGGLGEVRFNGPGTPAAPQLLESQSHDLGNIEAGYAHNFAFNTLSLVGTTYVRLVDQSDNAIGADPEAVYVDTLIVPVGATLDLNGLHLYTRSMQVAGTILNGQVIQVLPAVTQVLVASTAWSPAYVAQLQAAGLGDGGYRIPGNAADQLAPLPWRNLDQIKIVFNEDVNVQVDSLTISSANLDAISVIPLDFSYDTASHTATWTLAQPIGNDTFSLALASTGPAAVTDSQGAALDGDWPSATGNYPSGNGESGGDFYFSFNVLPGDVTRDGVVDIQDITNVASRWLQASPMSDANGDGVVDIQETTLIASNWLMTNSGASGGGGGSVGGEIVDVAVSPAVEAAPATASLPDSALTAIPDGASVGPAPIAKVARPRLANELLFANASAEPPAPSPADVTQSPPRLAPPGRVIADDAKIGPRGVNGARPAWLFGLAVDKVLTADNADDLYDARIASFDASVAYLPAASVVAALPPKVLGTFTPKVFTRKA